jgi:hypothetical protein
MLSTAAITSTLNLVIDQQGSSDQTLPRLWWHHYQEPWYMELRTDLPMMSELGRTK